MQSEKGFKDGKVWATTLIVLAVADIVPAIFSVILGLSMGWPDLQPDENGAQFALGMAFLTIFLQFFLRTASLAVMMRWAWRLVANGHRQGRLPVSPLWAWLGFVVPVGALWLPVRTFLALNRGGGPAQRATILGWWILRLMTVPSVFIISMFIVFSLTGDSQDKVEEINRNANTWLVLMLTTGIAARALEIVVVIMTRKHQSKVDVTAANVF